MLGKGVMDILPIVFRLFGKKQQAIRLVNIVKPAIDKIPPEAAPLIRQMIALGKQLQTMLTPAYQTIKPNLPEAVSIVQDIWRTAFPELAARWRNMPVEQMVSAPWWIQTTLNRLGADPQLKVDNDIGESTKEAIRKFQKTHKQTDGKPLAVDGYAGFETLAAMYAELVKLPTKPKAT